MGISVLENKSGLPIKEENGRYVKITSSTKSYEDKHHQILLSGRGFEVFIGGVTVHQMITHVMGETSLEMKRAMRDHLNSLIEREESGELCS
jgi:hypothetical protein